MRRAGWIVAAAMASLAIGCDKDKGPDKAPAPASPAAGAKTPKDAVLHFARAFETGDKGLFLATLQAGPGDRVALETTFDVAVATAKFRDKMVKAYGPDAMGNGRIRGPIQMPSQEEIESHLHVTERGDTAVAITEGDKNALNLVKVGGVWKIAAGALARMGDYTPEEMAMTSQAILKAIEQVSPHIGQSGTTAQSIIEEKNRRMAEAMNEMMP